MDFFDKQDRARRRTKWLVVYFVLAVLGIILTLHVSFAFLMGYFGGDLQEFGLEVHVRRAVWHYLTDWRFFGIISGGVVAAVILGSVVKMIELSQGGKAVAAMLGGVPVDMNSHDPAEQRLINVVEEMSIASGVPVPEIFVLDDGTINAFAAGHGPGDTAIGVTRGCVEKLSRDELQGVIGHEFSHILHGDMRLNIRLIGLLNGILFLAIIGEVLIRIGANSGRSSSRDGKGSAAPLLVCGLILYLVGWIGVFFGTLIRAAVSRQREYLADASSVQYTRNPEGLAGALAKIGNFSSRIGSAHASEASHMFFGNGLGDPWAQMFATHPPIEDRISQIAPGFDRSAAKFVPPPPTRSPAGGGRKFTGGPLLPWQPQLAAAAGLLAGLPEFSKTASHELHGACALVYSFLLSDDVTLRGQQIERLDPTVRAETLADFARRTELSSAQKIGLIDIAIPTLRHLSPEQYAVFRSNVKKLIETDGQIHLFEYTLQKILLRHLDLYFSNATGPRVRYKSLVPLLPDVGVVLSALANSDDGTAHDAAFAAGVKELLVNASSFPLVRAGATDLAAFDAALDHLAEAATDIKRIVLTACGSVVMYDGGVNDPQIELLRAIADTLDCPIPPFVRIS